MKVRNTTGVVLNRVKSTSLYQPDKPGPEENLFFLRWDDTNPPASLPLESTWAESGTPPAVGYYLFLNVLPTAADAPAFEAEVRKLVVKPTSSAFAWVFYKADSKQVNVQTLLKTRLDNANRPCVDGDTVLFLLPGQETVGFSDGSPIFANYAASFIDGFVISYPPMAQAEVPDKKGLTLPMTGSLVGCAVFDGLINRFSGRKVIDRARKTMVIVSVDPLHPINQKRNFQLFTGQDYILTQIGNSYYISRAS